MRVLTMQRRSIYPLALALMAAFALVAFLLTTGRTFGTPQGPTVALELQGDAKAGQAITVRVVAYNMRNLAGFQSTVNFDPQSLRLTDAKLGDDLKSSGRDLMPLGPVLRDGSAVLGAATCPVANCADRRIQQARRITQGVNGNINLGEVSFYAEKPGRYTLKLDGVKLVDPQGNPLTANVADTVIDVTAP